jgi:hypothetical protein
MKQVSALFEYYRNILSVGKNGNFIIMLAIAFVGLVVMFVGFIKGELLVVGLLVVVVVGFIEGELLVVGLLVVVVVGFIVVVLVVVEFLVVVVVGFIVVV